MTHNNDSEMLRILCEDVGETALFAPGMGYKRAQARHTVLHTVLAPAMALLAACRALMGRLAA